MNRYPTRPGRVVAAAVFLIIYGGVNLVCSLCVGIGITAGDPNEALIARDAPAYEIVNITQAVSNLLTGAAMIALGVGVLQLMPLARIGAYVICSYELILMFAHSIYAVLFVIPVAERVFAGQAQNNPAAPFDMGKFMQGFLWANLAFAMVLTLSFCGLILVFLSGAKARAVFASEYQGEPPPRERRSRRDDDEEEVDDYRPPPKSSPDTGITERPS